jgi:hypothetical protein
VTNSSPSPAGVAVRHADPRLAPGDERHHQRPLGEKYDFEPSSEQARSAYEAYLMPITGVTGMPRPARMHYAMAWSEDACRVAKAAEFRGEAVAAAVLRRLRETWFPHGRPADTPARGLPGQCSAAGRGGAPAAGWAGVAHRAGVGVLGGVGELTGAPARSGRSGN